MQPFDLNTVDISGKKLVEASAGTGKTYAIASLYIRLIVERDLRPENILVVTFTEAATKELRGRIRARIRETISVLQGEGTEDIFLKKFVANVNGKMPETAVAIDRLNRALVGFDLASIYTIHGFCLRALQDHAFESGALFDTELAKDGTALLQEAVEDFWRSRFFGGDSPLLPLVLRNGWSVGGFTALFKGKVTNPHLSIIPDYGAEAVASFDDRIVAAYCSLQENWNCAADEIWRILREDKGLRRTADTFKVDVLERLLNELAVYLEEGNPYAFFKGLERFSASFMMAKKKEKVPPPAHPFFDLCEELNDLLERRLKAFIGEAAGYVRSRLPERKAAANVRCFDDLLNDLHEALLRDTDGKLAEKLRRRYGAALIDEFQDTDPVQYRIFTAIYEDGKAPLFLIGDPKQAIYSFRGADIFAYIEAKAQVADGSSYTMNRNWRSTADMLDAFNTLFGRPTPPPFVYDSIGYHPVEAGKKSAEPPLVLPEKFPSSPLQVWFVPRGEERVIPSTRGKKIVAEMVAAEISRLLDDGRKGVALVDGRPVLPEDIAVIVRSHSEARLIQGDLRQLRIPSVTQATGSVFDTAEARDVFTLMAALAEPSDEGKVRAALITDFFGLSGNDLDRFRADTLLWEPWLQKFREYHELWREDGFLVASRTLLDAGEGRGRLLSLPDGERRLTNILHLFEIIHAAAASEGLAMEGLLTWFGEKVDDPPSDEEYQIRLESDEKAVRIVTIHVSKGLEYPIVFCPFCFGGVREGETALFHDEAYRQVLDIGSEKMADNSALARKEELAENLRLLYVALTRAKYRCYLVWGRFRNSESSAPAYLLHYPEEANTDGDLVTKLEEAVAPLGDAAMLARLAELSEKSPAIAVQVGSGKGGSRIYGGSVGGGQALGARSFSGEIDRSWRIASFTGFAENSNHDPEYTDRDEIAGSSEEGEARGRSADPFDIFSFPKGAKAGIFLHKIFEKLDFAGGSEAASALTKTLLAADGFDPAWYPAVAGMVNNVLSERLLGSDDEFTLSALGKGDWKAELDFFFPLKFVTSERLRGVLRGASPETPAVDLARVASRLGFRPAKGMVRGFIDMLFRWQGRYYIVDWKSNHLGYTTADYAAPRLAREMERNLYPLQYLLYTTAVNRFLSLRIPGYSYETHFGGVLYLFIRGIDASSQTSYGVFRDVPAVGLVDALTETLIGVGG